MKRTSSNKEDIEMAKEKIPSTPALRVLKKSCVSFSLHPYRYEEKGGTEVAARELGVDEHAVIKTLVMEDEARRPLVILMHGDRKVSTKELARAVKAKRVHPCEPDTAQRHTGYFVGGTSPFGTRKALKVYMERTILDLDQVYVNAGRKGLLARLSSPDLAGLTDAEPVNVAIMPD